MTETKKPLSLADMMTRYKTVKLQHWCKYCGNQWHFDLAGPEGFQCTTCGQQFKVSQVEGSEAFGPALASQ